MPGRGAQGAAQVVPIKGVEGFNRRGPVVGPTYVDATERRQAVAPRRRLWTVAVATFKAETYRFLRLSGRRSRSAAAISRRATSICRDGVDAEWLKQFVAEQLVTVKTRRGFARLEWQKLRERNEALDCRVYARAAAWIAGLDRWCERKWPELEKQLGVVPSPPAIAPAADASLDRSPADRARARGSASAHPSGWLGARPREWLQRR